LRENEKELKRKEEEEVGRFRCFLIESRERFRFVNSYGVPVPAKRLKEDQFDYDERLALANSNISCTDSRRSYFTKISVHENKPGEIELGIEALESMRRKLDNTRSKDKALFWKEIPQEHCTICFGTDHFRENCERYGWCKKTGHYKKQCPWRPYREN